MLKVEIYNFDLISKNLFFIAKSLNHQNQILLFLKSKNRSSIFIRDQPDILSHEILYFPLNRDVYSLYAQLKKIS